MNVIGPVKKDSLYISCALEIEIVSGVAAIINNKYIIIYGFMCVSIWMPIDMYLELY